MKKTWRKLVAMASDAVGPAPADRPLNYVDIFPAAPRLKILLVEDDEPDAYLIRRALESNRRVGEVVIAEDGVKALELVDKGWFAPDMAIIDLHMPRKDGFSLLREFAGKDRRHFPSVILTSSAARADAHRAMHCGAVEFVTKPDTVEKLAAALDRVIYNAV